MSLLSQALLSQARHRDTDLNKQLCSQSLCDAIKRAMPATGPMLQLHLPHMGQHTAGSASHRRADVRLYLHTTILLHMVMACMQHGSTVHAGLMSQAHMTGNVPLVHLLCSCATRKRLQTDCRVIPQSISARPVSFQSHLILKLRTYGVVDHTD